MAKNRYAIDKITPKPIKGKLHFLVRYVANFLPGQALSKLVFWPIQGTLYLLEKFVGSLSLMKFEIPSAHAFRGFSYSISIMLLIILLKWSFEDPHQNLFLRNIFQKMYVKVIYSQFTLHRIFFFCLSYFWMTFCEPLYLKDHEFNLNFGSS